jgi:Flp pilus assembly secretin CpaC
MDQSNSRRRPWLRFTLLNLLVLTFGIALGLAPLKLWELAAPAKPEIVLEIQVLEVPVDVIPQLGPSITASGLSGGHHVVDTQRLNQQIETLKAKGLKVMASPMLNTRSGRPTSFNVGGQVPVPVTDSSGLTTVEYKDFGTSVDIVPTIQRNGRIGLVVDSEQSRIAPQPTSDALEYPVIESVSTTSNAELASGETLVLGGQAVDSGNAARGVLVIVATVRRQGLH